MKISNRVMLLGGVMGVVLTAAQGLHAQSDTPPMPGGMAPRHAWMFQEADADKDGHVSRAEFDSWRDARFAAIDADGDSKLSKDEFQAHRAQRQAGMMPQPGMAPQPGMMHQNGIGPGFGDGRQGHGMRLLERADTSGDGRVTADEWQAESLRRFVRLDANGDGAVTADEIAARHDRKMTQGQMGQHDVPRMDADGDGWVTRSEWDAAGGVMFARMDANGDGRIELGELPRHDRLRSGGSMPQP